MKTVGETSPRFNRRATLLAHFGAAAIGILPNALATDAQAKPNLSKDAAKEARVLAQRIHEGKKVTADGNHTILWSRPDSKKKFQFFTAQPLEAKVDGAEQFFMTVPPKDCSNGTRKDIGVRYIPHAYIKGIARSAVLFSGVHPPGEEKRVINHQVVVSLNSEHLPVARWNLSDGTSIIGGVGITTAINSDAITLP